MIDNKIEFSHAPETPLVASRKVSRGAKKWDNKNLLSVLDVEQYSTLTDRLQTLSCAKELRSLLREEFIPSMRPRAALFTHSLERNGANNFCLLLVRELLSSQEFVIFTPKNGPMREDFVNLGCPVVVVDTADRNFFTKLHKLLCEYEIRILIANTIMRSDVVIMAKKVGLSTIWVIHESWPREKIAYYAQEVFMQKDLSAEVVKRAFQLANCIVFPSKVQMDVYQGLYSELSAKTIYNGISLKDLDAYRSSQDRDVIRAQLGYGSDVCLVLHIGTICERKGQVYTAKACSELMAAHPNSRLKTLLVGARYIRDHEIAYIDRIKKTIQIAKRTWTRWEDTKDADRGQSDFTIMDVQSNVMRFYMAADIVVVPSLNEVLPLVIGESMAFERPIVCSRIDAIPEAVEHNVEGLLVEAANSQELRDAIWRLASDPGLRRQLGLAGRRRVERQFSLPSMCSCYRELIDMLTPTKQHASPLPVDQRLLYLSKPLTVLVDMDNTLVDWDGEFIRRYNEVKQESVDAAVRSRAHYEIERNFPEFEQALVLRVIQSDGFYESLEPYPGAIDSLKTMLSEGINVRIVTAPHLTCAAQCAKEKISWVEQRLGVDWVGKVTVTCDKTIVDGDFIIDDKPRITGSNPNWRARHIIFSQSYNQEVATSWRLNQWSGHELQDLLARALEDLSQ